MFANYSEKVFKIFSPLINELIVKIAQQFLFWQGWYNQSFIVFADLQLFLEPFKVREASQNY